jgi:excisionase family DNA binding protein
MNTKQNIKKRKEQDDCVSLTEAAGLMFMSRSTLYRFIDEGMIKKVVRGKSPKIQKSEIEKYLTVNS